MPEHQSFTIEIEQEQDYAFKVKFDSPAIPALRMDEPPPLGASTGPNAARLVAAAVANCLSASLLFCMRDKFKQRPGKLRATATARLGRTTRGRLRIDALEVAIGLGDRTSDVAHLDRCIEQFEDFCVVTESVRRGIPVSVQVRDREGRVIYEANDARDASASREIHAA